MCVCGTVVIMVDKLISPWQKESLGQLWSAHAQTGQGPSSSIVLQYTDKKRTAKAVIRLRMIRFCCPHMPQRPHYMWGRSNVYMLNIYICTKCKLRNGKTVMTLVVNKAGDGLVAFAHWWRVGENKMKIVKRIWKKKKKKKKIFFFINVVYFFILK